MNIFRNLLPQSGHRRLQLLVFLATLIACSWFFTPGTWNAHVRFDSIYCLVEDGTLTIDKFIIDPEKNINTGDWAYKDGHFYSTKAPGSMFIGALAHAPVYWGSQLLGIPASMARDQFFAWWINFWCGPVPTALAALWLFCLLTELGFSQRRSLFWALLFGLGTPMWPFSTQLWGHPLAAAAVMGAIYALWRPDNRRYFLGGLAIGVAVLADYAAAFAIPCLALPYLRDRNWRGIFRVALGGLGPLLLFLWYHWACFGNPVTIGNAYANPIFLKSDGAGGMMTNFKPLILWKQLFSTHRGVFLASPIAALALPGFMALWRQRRRCEAAGLALIFLIGLVSTAAYGFWHGGATSCARFLIYAIPAWILLAAHWDLSTPQRQWLATILAVVSLSNSLVMAIMSPITMETRQNPIYQDTYYLAYGNGATHTFRSSRGVRLYYYDGERPRNETLFIASLGRCFVGHTPWSDLVLLGGVMAGLFALLGRGNLNLREILQQWWRCLAESEYCRKLASLFRGHWCWFLVAGGILAVLLPGIVRWGDAEARWSQSLYHRFYDGHLGQAMPGRPDGALSLWCYQVFMSLFPSPLFLVVAKSLTLSALNAGAVLLICRKIKWQVVPTIALILSIPMWWFANRSLDTASFALPAMLLAFAAVVDHDKSLKDFLIMAAGMLLAVWGDARCWPILFAIPTALFLQTPRGCWRKTILWVLGTLLLAWALLYQRGLPPAGSSGAESWQVLLTTVLTLPGAISSAGFTCGQLPEFLDGWPNWAVSLWQAGEFLTVLIAIVLLIAGIITAIRGPRRHPAAFAALVYLCLTLTELGVRCPAFREYRLLMLPAILILALTGVSALQALLPKLTPRLMTTFVAINLVVVLAFAIRVNHTAGNDQRTYGSTLGEQWAAAKEMAVVHCEGYDMQVSFQRECPTPTPQALSILADNAYILSPAKFTLLPRKKRGIATSEVYLKEPGTGKLDVQIYKGK